MNPRASSTGQGAALGGDVQTLSEARRLEAAGHYEGARALYLSVLKTNPRAPDLHFAIGFCELNLLNYAEAVRRTGDAIRLRADAPHYHTVRGVALAALQRLDEADASVERALALAPEDAFALRVKADFRRLRGDAEAAYAVLRPALDRGVRSPDLLASFGAACAGCGRLDEGVRELEPASGDDALPPTARASLLMALGTLHDRGGRHDAAFEAWRSAHALRAGRYDPDAHTRLTDERIAAWTPERFSRLPRSRSVSERMVFIVGMPRSGTTLVEQIIASHPAAAGLGERPQVTLAASALLGPWAHASREPDGLARALDGLRGPALDQAAGGIESVFRSLAPRATRICDKAMQNFQHLGLIALLFPKARIVHCTRDPMDTGLSCYAQDFQGARNQPFVHDLAHLGRYIRDYERLMAHWRGLSAASGWGPPILDVAYEDLVRNPEAQSRHLLEFLGLAWDPAVLTFYEHPRTVVTLSAEAVRKPLHPGSIGRHQRYGPALRPLEAALGLSAG